MLVGFQLLHDVDKIKCFFFRNVLCIRVARPSLYCGFDLVVESLNVINEIQHPGVVQYNKDHPQGRVDIWSDIHSKRLSKKELFYFIPSSTIGNVKRS